MTYADIIIDISCENLDRTFQYRIPEALKEEIRPGMVVSIPFGNGNRMRKGYVVGLSDTPEFDVDRMKDVAEVHTGEETTESRLIALAAWMRENYGSTMIQALRTVIPVQRKVKARKKPGTPPESGDIPQTPPAPLTDSQRAAADKIIKEWEAPAPRPALLFGVTGSGKTEVYMELIGRVLAEGKQAIVLIPEIALTYQTARRFYARFGDRVSVLNSRLSSGERYDRFRRAKSGELSIMVGPRSALFTPFSQLGLIIVDEEHEPTYKSENSPRYHAREVAEHRARMEGARVVLGSATPSLEVYSRALAGDYLLVKLTRRYEERPLPQAAVTDMRAELKKGCRSVFGRELREDLEVCLQKGHQAMLFLNRRGYAGFVSCRSCGHVMKCPHCDVSLSEHNGGRLVCHYCGYQTAKPQTCPECGSPYIGGFKAGTQQIERLVKKEFPEAKVLRMDFDTTRTKGSYEEILAAFAAHQADILIGTQMIVKGHDFPDVTLVGVVAADLSLNNADYRCGERTFQLLTQAMGRSGRGRFPGKAVIQTYNPDHYSIRAAACQDYEAFYREEMNYRELLDYPPAAHMLAVLGSCADEAQLAAAMHYLSLFVRKICPGKSPQMIGPAPASVGKVKDVYRQVFYLKHRDYRLLVSIKDRLEKYIEANSGFRKIYIQFDFT